MLARSCGRYAELQQLAETDAEERAVYEQLAGVERHAPGLAVEQTDEGERSPTRRGAEP